MTLDKLIEDGRIHPARIEEMYYQAKAELEEHVLPGGRAGRLRGELRRVPRGARAMLGRLRTARATGRTS